MKKRIIALALCLVMLLGCLGMGVDALTDTAPLYDRLIAAQTAEEFDAIAESATEEELSALSEDQLTALDAHYGEIYEGEKEIYYPAPEFTVAGPLLGNSVSVSSNNVATNKETSNTAARAVSKLRSFGAVTTNNTPEPIEENGVIMTKSSERVAGSSDDDPIYQITLNAEAKSNIVNVSVPCDIVLVLDRSGSMADNNKKNVNSLISSVNAFLTQVQEMSPESRIAIVTYASDSTIDSGTKAPAGAFVPITKNDKVNDELTTIINGLVNRCVNGTKSNLGMKNAVSIFQAVPSNDANYDNTRATILFTDGAPGNNGWERLDGFQGEENSGYFVAQESIHWSTILKASKGTSVTLNLNDAFYDDYSKSKAKTFNGMTTGCGSTVYCVGLNLPNYEAPNWLGKASDGAKINEYMYRVSSHRPDGSHVTKDKIYNSWESSQDEWSKQYRDDLTRNRPEGSYYAVGDNDALNDIFTKIASQTGKPVENVVVRDYISEYFDICDSNGNKLSVGDTINDGSKTGTICSDEQGKIYIEWTNITLKPEQVDANGNVTEEAQKFDASIYVKPKDGFLGGNDVPTNGSESAIYDGDAELAKFPEPSVDVPINFNLQAVDKDIYLLDNTLKVEDLYTLTNSKIEPWQKNFVTIKAESDKAISNTEDGSYKLTVTVSPKSVGTATEKTGTATAKVNVYTPVVTFQDSAIDLGQTPNYATDNYLSVAWKHGTQTADISKMGTAPELNYKYSLDASDFKEDTLVEVTAVMQSGTATDVKQYAKFELEHCGFPGCDSAHGNWKFIVHIKTFDLTITKNINRNESKLYGSQDFVFNVKSNDGATDIDVVVNVPDGAKTGSVTIKGLPVGTYTITEDTGWSWRYQLNGAAAASGTAGEVVFDKNSHSATYTPDGVQNEIVFTNNWVEAKWLSFTDSVKNFFGMK